MNENLEMQTQWKVACVRVCDLLSLPDLSHTRRVGGGEKRRKEGVDNNAARCVATDFFLTSVYAIHECQLWSSVK